MPSLDETFDLLVEHLREPEKLNPARSDPFFYFVHAPEDTLTVKQKIAVWTSFLTNEGWTVGAGLALQSHLANNRHVRAVGGMAWIGTTRGSLRNK